MDFKRTKEILVEFASTVVKLAKRNARKKKASGSLQRSISYNLHESENSMELDFKMNSYGKYIDAGVDGKKVKYGSRKFGLPTYSYKDKMPPTKKLDKWVVRKNLKGIRDDKGRFKNRQSLLFAISKSIFRRGFKPTYFFTQAFEQEYKKLPTDFLDAYSLDVLDFLKQTTKTQ